MTQIKYEKKSRESSLSKSKDPGNFGPQVKHINNDIARKANILSECTQRCNLQLHEAIPFHLVQYL